MRKLHEPDEASLPVARSWRPAVASLNETSGIETRPDISAPGLHFDWTDWLPYLEDQDVPEAQKRELIETLWSIVVAFVDLGWQLNTKPKIGGEVLDLKAILESVNDFAAKEAE